MENLSFGAKQILQNTYMGLVKETIKNKPKVSEIPMSKHEIEERAAKHKIGRNSLCPCCSGKKYKNCCGRNI